MTVRRGRRFWIGGALALPLGAALGGALALADFNAGRDHDNDDAPTAAPLPSLPPRRLAWVFGSGGPRGFVHVGVVKALHELGLRPDVVVGSSAGAIVATWVAAGLPAAELEALALDLPALSLMRWNARVGGDQPWWSGRALARWVGDTVGGRPLQALQRPLVVVARRDDGAVVGFTHGLLAPALQASMAVEQQFVPVRIRGRWHTDADGVMPLPVRLARERGAARVLAVDVSAHEQHAPPGAERWREHDRRKRAITQPDAAAADVLLHPDSGYWSGLSREYRAHCIAVGYATTMAAAPTLRTLHAG